MKKRYFTKYLVDSVWKGYLEAKEEDIEKVVELAGTVYVPKEDIENIEEYRIEGETSDEIMRLEDTQDYVFLHIDELTHDERLYLEGCGYCHLEDLEATEDIDIDELTDEEYDELEKEIFEKLEKSIIEKMKHNQEETDMQWHEIGGWWDGSNWRTEILNHYYYDTCWKEVTEELEGLKDIDSKTEKYGKYILYLLRDGRRMLKYISFWQGELSKVCIIDEEVDTVEEAIRIVEEKERDYKEI